MPTAGTIIRRKKVTPHWWKQTNSEEDKAIIRDAVAVYCYENDLSAKDINASKDDIIPIIPTVGRYINKWNSIDTENFTLTVPAHRSLFDTMRNLIISKKTLQTMINEMTAQKSSESDVHEEEDENAEDEHEPEIDPFEEQDKKLQTHLTPRKGSEVLKKSVDTSPKKDTYPKLGQKRQNPMSDKDDDIEPPISKRPACLRLQDMYEKMLGSRSQAKKDE